MQSNKPDGAIAVLNALGIEKFGKIFPESEVPLRHIGTRELNIGGIVDHFYFADFKLFTDDQRRDIKKFMNDERHIPRDKVELCIQYMDYQVPLSARYVGYAYEVGGLKFA